MSQREMTFKIEELRYAMEQINSLQTTLFAAIYRQKEFSAEDFEWAFTLLEDISGDVLNKLIKLTNCAFENLRKDGEKNV